MIKVHFVGIGGTGISAIARVLLEKGWQVSGTDMQASTYFNAVTLQGQKPAWATTPIWLFRLICWCDLQR